MSEYIRCIFKFECYGGTYEQKCVMQVDLGHHLCSAERTMLLLPLAEDEDAFYMKAGEWKGSLLSPPAGVQTFGTTFKVKGGSAREEITEALAKGRKGWRGIKPSTLRAVTCERCFGRGYKLRYPKQNVTRTYPCPACGQSGEVYRYVVDTDGE